jgi:hypothetical protein
MVKILNRRRLRRLFDIALSFEPVVEVIALPVSTGYV